MNPPAPPYVHPDAPKLLIVDDAPSITQPLVAYFHHVTINALAAYDGRKRADLAQRAQPDLIILDLGPARHGWMEVCRQIRHSSQVPIVILTKRNAGERPPGRACRRGKCDI